MNNAFIRLSILLRVLVAVLIFFSMGQEGYSKRLSERSVRTFMNYAWSLVPEQFTHPTGETILIDKTKKTSVLIPIDVAREVVRVGRLSAHAQLCDLAASQVANYRSMMRREERKKKWSQQQLVFISHLHLTTVMLLTGKIKLVDKDGNREVVIGESAEKKKRVCSEKYRKQVDSLIASYVKSEPDSPLKRRREKVGTDR